MMLANRREWIHRGARVCYHFCLAAYLVILILERYTWMPYGAEYLSVISYRFLPLVRYVLTALLAEKVIREKTRALPAVLIVALSWIWGEESLLDVSLFLCLSDLAEERKTVRTQVWLFLAGALLTVLLLWTGNVENTAKVFRYGRGYTFGFIHPNFVGGSFLAVNLAVWYLYLQKKQAWTWALFLFSAAVTSFVLACRTVAILMALFPAVFLGIQKAERTGGKRIGKAAQLLPLLCFLFTAAMIFTYAYGLIDWKGMGLPREMMLRFDYPARVIAETGLGWAKSGTVWDQYPIDSVYAYTLIHGGIFGCLLLLAQMTFVIRKCAHAGRADLLSMGILFSVYGLMERAPTILLWNFLPLILLNAAESKSGGESRQNWPRITSKGKILLTLGSAALFLGAALLLPARNDVPVEILTQDIERQYTGEQLNAETDERQSFTAEESFTGIQVLTATYCSIPYGSIGAELTDERGEILEKISLAAWNANDNCYLSIPLSREYPPGKYSLRIGETHLLLGAVSLWRNEDDPCPDGSLSLRGEETGSDWSFRLYRGAVSGRRILGRDCLMLWLACAAGIWMVPDLRRKKK